MRQEEMIAQELIRVASTLMAEDKTASNKTAFSRAILEALNILKAEGVKVRTVTQHPVAAVIEFADRAQAWFGINILKEEGYSVSIDGPASISVGTLR